MVDTHIPNPVQTAPPRRGVAAVAGDEVDQDVPGRARLAESERVVEEAHEIGRSVGLVERAAPGDVAGVGRAQVRQEVPARRRLCTVSGDEHVRLEGFGELRCTHQGTVTGQNSTTYSCCSPANQPVHFLDRIYRPA